MKKTSKIIVKSENPFSDCKLGREPIADSLTKIIEGFEENFVLGIDSPWGTGKTTFIEMWVQKLKSEKPNDIFPIYFNAWENDFHGEALSAIVGELDKQLKNNKNVKNDDYLKVVGNIAGNITKLITGGIVDPIKLKEELNATGKRILFDDYQLYETLKNEVKDDLKKLKIRLDVEKIVFFIDELDRCRPDYAVQTLEKIKHFFNVDNYVFVLALDKKQLSHSVATIYGEGMDSEGYLRRFIDLDYSLPNPSKENYLNYLIETHSLNENNKIFMDVIRRFAKESDVSLRDLEKLFYKIKLALPLFKKPQIDIDDYLENQFFAYFICINTKYNSVYSDLVEPNSKLIKEYPNYQSGSRTGDIKKIELFIKSLNWINFDFIEIKSIKSNGNYKDINKFGMLKLINDKISNPKNFEIGYIEYKRRNDPIKQRTSKYEIKKIFKDNKLIFKNYIEFIDEFRI